MCSNRYLIGVAVLAGTMMMAACSADETSDNGNAQKDGSIYLTSRVAQTRSLAELQINALNTASRMASLGIG